jgi:prepilin-type N-terminal cleavage/methylation domain-containing protein
MRKNFYWSGNFGFSLIEVMVGLVILTIAFIPLTGLITAHYKQIADAGIKITALDLAQRKMEEFKSKKKIDDILNEKIQFPDDEFKDRYQYKVIKIENNTYKIEIYYQQDKLMASLTGEIPTQ